VGTGSAGAESAGAESAGRALVTKAWLTVQQKADGHLTAAVAKPFAEAGRLLLTGWYGAAVAKLTEAYRTA
jgi:beta-glucosidase